MGLVSAENASEIPVQGLLPAISPMRSLGAIAGDLSIAVLSVWMSLNQPSWGAYPVAVILIGSRMRALGNLLHEAAHFRLFRSRWANQAAGRICAWLILQSFDQYRISHRLHHRRLGLEGDPDLLRMRELSGLPPLRPYIAFIESSLEADRQAAAKRLGALLVPVVFSIPFFGAQGVMIFLLFWCVPFFTSYAWIRYAAEMSEHAFPPQGSQLPRDLFARAGLLTSDRDFGLVLNALVFPHGDRFHLLHHRFPSVPGWQLSKMHAEGRHGLHAR